MNDEDKKALEEMIKYLEARASDFDKPLPNMNRPGDKELHEWHCHSRAAGIRDAVHSIRLRFKL